MTETETEKPLTRWSDGVSLFINATPEDDGGKEYDIWHNGGPGGQMLVAHSEEAALAICAAVDELLELREEVERLHEDIEQQRAYSDLLRKEITNLKCDLSPGWP